MIHPVKTLLYNLLVCTLFFSCNNKLDKKEILSDYNIVWTTQSKNATESMPVGGGNIQLNAWCENNEILFYLGSTDSYMDNSQNLGKLGRVRLNFSPNPFKQEFRQELRLKESEMVFTGDNGFELTLWVDVFNPVVHVNMQSSVPVEVTANYETWALNKSYTQKNEILFYHRNASTNEALEKLIREQKAESFRDKITDPIVNLTSGGMLYGEGFIPTGVSNGTYMKTPYEALQLKSESAMKSMDLRLAIRIKQDESLEKWEKEVNNIAAGTKETTEKDKKLTQGWWKEFWERSYIYINPYLNAQKAQTADILTDSIAAAWLVGRNYQLFRYMMGCSRNAIHPVLFNGGIFNVDNPNGKLPEFRNWQDCEFMAQNQRLVYWPLLKSGDKDLMQPVINQYTGQIDLQTARAKEYWGIEGSAYPEGLNIYGLHSVYVDPETMVDCFGRCPSRKRTEYGHSGYIHLEYHYTSMLDFAYMLLESARFGNEKLEEYMPVIENAVKFYDNYYQNKHIERNGTPLTNDGKLEFYPSSALELYAGAKNPTDVVSGLHALVNGVLSFPSGELTNEQLKYFTEVNKRLPDIPTVVKDGYTVLPPAESWELEGDQPNMEFPQLYTLFPFETYSFNTPDGLEIAKNTWLHNSKASAQKNYICWFQGGIYAAHLGLTDEAKTYALQKFLHPDVKGVNKNAVKMRFPAFWSSPYFCHTPDMDHGGTAMIGLQDMLIQTPGEKIYLLPAWAKDWDVDFKLHAPYKTVVECSYRNGKIEKLEVTPAERKNDIVMMNNVHQ